MRLGRLISELASADQDYVAPMGFGVGQSYRGYYEDLAFEPKRNVSVREMLAHAMNAMGKEMEGYKGGAYLMNEWTECWIADYGSSDGDCIGPTLVAYLTGRTHDAR